jgi:hypothetical protein
VPSDAKVEKGQKENEDFQTENLLKTLIPSEGA